MAKVYMLRHRDAGILTAHVFLRPPTDAQIEPIAAECARVHGPVGWLKVHEADLIDDEAPYIAPPPVPTVQRFEISGVGEVK